MAGRKTNRVAREKQSSLPAKMVGCTIATPDTIPHAQILARSFKRFHPDSRFFALVLARNSPATESNDGIEWLSLSDLSLEPDDRHSLPLICGTEELVRAVKPALLRTLLGTRGAVVAYFDVATKVFAPLDELEELARKESIVLFPLPSPAGSDFKRYDTGTILVSAGSEIFLDWWRERTRAQSYQDPTALRATEQLSLDSVSGLFPKRGTVTAPASNASYRNLPGHSFTWTGQRYEIDGQPLRLFRFAGYDPSQPHLLSKRQGEKPPVLLSREPALARLCEEYREELLHAISAADRPGLGSFESLSDGLKIDRHIRRIYREALAEFRAANGAAPPDPFAAGGAAALIEWLNEPVPGAAGSITRYLFAIRESRPDVQLVFPDPLGEDAAAFLEWFALHGRHEEQTAEALVPAYASPPATAPEAAEARPNEQINVAGYFRAELGLGEAARLLLTALEASGAAYRAIPYAGTVSRQNHPFKSGRKSASTGDINLICVNADQLPQFARQSGALFRPGRYSIGVWFWEVEDFPAELHPAFDYVDEIWVASEFMRQTLLKVSPRPVFKFPLPIVVPEIDPALSRADLGLPERFSFLFSFDFLSVLERKNPIGLIDAFKRAFRPGEGPALVIKTINGDQRILALEKLLFAAADHPDIVIRDGYLSAVEKNTLTARCDCYISLHRSEGFGLTMAEAMALGRPTIATGYSGNLEFMNAENSFLCSFTPRKIGPGAEPYPATSQWAEPDLDEAAELMRRVYRHPKEAAARVAKALKEIERFHSPAAAGKTISDQLALIRGRRPFSGELAASRLARKPMTAKQLRDALARANEASIAQEKALARVNEASTAQEKALARANEVATAQEDALARANEASAAGKEALARAKAEAAARQVKLEGELQQATKRSAEHEENFKQLQKRFLALETDLVRKEEALSISENERRELEKRVRTILERSRAEARLAQTEAAALSARLEKVEREAWEDKVRRAAVTARLHQRDQALQQIQASPVWKAAKPLWKFHRRLLGEKTREENVTREELLFALDAPVTWTTSREIVVVRGWCFARGGHALAGIRAKIGKKSHLARYGLPRPDLPVLYPSFPEAAHAGFSIEIKGVPAGASSVRLEAIVQGQDWQPFFEHELVRTPDPNGKISSGEWANGNEEPSSGAKESAGTQSSLILYPGLRPAQLIRALEPLFHRHAGRALGERPVFSIITPTHNTKPQWLAEAAASLLHQTFPDWEWCIVDDGSENRELREMLEKFKDLSPHVRVKFVPAGGISAANNHGLEMARGDYVCFLDHDDLLAVDALAVMTERIKENFDAVYSDEDKLDEARGELVEEFFKPDWSPEYFRGVMYVGHLLCLRRELALKTRFNSEFDGVQDFEFMLRVSETGAKIGHISRILYHWRKTPGSIAEKGDAKPRIAALQQQAVMNHLARVGLPARAEPSAHPHRLKIMPAERSTFPAISIIIPTRDAPELLERCLKSISEKTSYPELEVIVMDNETTNEDALRLMEEYPVRRIEFPDPFNFSRANNLGADSAAGEFLLFLNNDTEIVAEDWLQQLLYYAEQPDVGAVGALLLYENRTVQHAGVALGMRGTADHTMRGFPSDVDGYAGSLACAREVSAVTAACLMMRKSLFLEVGGFNEHFFTAYQDVDLCLRLRDRGLRIIYTPRAVVVHHESASRKTYYDMVDRMLLLDRWEPVIERGDPYYNPNLALESGDYSRRS
jgi:GT2 family glycosyltransferase